MSATKLELIRAYKLILKDALEARPSGIRLRIADTIGKNKSFISQITNPNYKTPLPEKYIEPIFDAVHLTPRERERFLEIYRKAHPRSRPQAADKPEQDDTRMLRIELPRLGSQQLERRIDALIVQMARNINDLGHRR